MDTDQLTGLLQKTIDFALNGVSAMSAHPPTWEENLAGPAALQDKVVTETLLLVLLLARVPGLPSAQHAALRQLCAVCEPYVRGARSAAMLSRHPHMAVPLGISDLALTRMGYQNAAFSRAIRLAVSSGQAGATERLPYRAMELRWLQALLADTQETSAIDDLLPVSRLGVDGHSLRMEEADYYALTHGLMYVTDFGSRPLPAALSAKRLAKQIDVALAAQVLAENLDIMGELLMSAVFIRCPWSPRARFAWQMLLDSWTQFEFLPCPSLQVHAYRSLRGEAARAYAFRHTYHTTYVGAILCSLLLRWPDVLKHTPASLEVSAVFATALEVMLARMETCPALRGVASGHWIASLDQSGLGRQDLLGMLTDGLAVTAFSSDDLVTLSGLLADHKAAGLPRNDVLNEAAAYLADQYNSGILPPEVALQLRRISEGMAAPGPGLSSLPTRRDCGR